MRLLTAGLLAAAAIGSGAWGVTSPSYSVGASATPTCHGRAATIVSDQQDVEGTQGDDVVVVTTTATAPLVRIHLGDGDDLLCLAGAGAAYVNAGSGDDVVDASGQQATGRVTAVLGDGADTFTGGPESDRVTDDTQSDRRRSPLSSDTVSTGAGDDEVFVGAQAPAGAEEPSPPVDHDRVDLGPGHDYAYLYSDSTGRITGGQGTDEIDFASTAFHRSGRLDDVVGRLTLDGQQLTTWSGVESFAIYGEVARLTLAGSDASEAFKSFDTTHLTGSLGGGNDYLGVNDFLGTNDFADIDGGPGRDTVNLPIVQQPGLLDLRSGETRVGIDHGSLQNFENASVLDDDDAVTLIGTDGPNRLKAAAGCGPTVRGLGGADRISAVPNEEIQVSCDSGTPSGMHEYGGDGPDRLLGTKFRDVLIGGSGHDYADGFGATDQCSAEVRKACERR